MAKLTGWMWRYLLTVLSTIVCIALTFPSSVLAGSQKAARQNATTPSDYTDQLIIRYKDNTLVRNAAAGKVQALSALSERLNVLNRSTGMSLSHHRFMSGNGQVVKLPGIMTLAKAEAVAARLKTNPDVAYAEPDRRMRPLLIPNDPLYANQWQYATPASFAGGANLPGAWNLTTGSSSVVIAVIDTGILPNHADIAGRTLPGYNFISNGVMAGNGSGRSSDATDLGDFVTSAESADSSSILFECEVTDSSWHGTHVTGTIGAASNNGVGVAGINWVSSILPVRTMGKCGGYISDISDGMRWAAGLAVSGVPANANPAKVLNMSLGGTGACGLTFQSAVDDVVATGTTVAVAAGNESDDVTNSSPANCNGVISVAAVDQTGGRAYYSNFGSGVKIAAPGGDLSTDMTKGILSTLNSGLTTAIPGGDIYSYYQGTSMATAHVAGIVSLMLSQKSALTPSQILTLLQSSARKFPANTASSGGDCISAICGAGIIDAAAAVASVEQPIVSTTAVTVVNATTATSGGNVTSAGGSTVTARGVCWSTATNPTLADSCTTNDSGTGTFTSTISGLSANTTYYIRAYAGNAFGTTYGNERSVIIPVDKFLPKISTSATSEITTTSAVSGGDISSDGGVPVTARGVCWSTAANPTTATACTFSGSGTGSFSSSISGLTANLTYHVRAFATNAVGTAYGLDQNFNTSTAPPTVLTAAATLITNSAAVSGGNVTLGGGAEVKARGVCWGTVSNPTLADSCTSNGSGTGQYKSTISGLAANTQYHVRAYATNVNNSTSYGTDLTFRTLAAATVPTVLTTMPIRSITSTSATGGGNVISSGGNPVTDRGICWSISSDPATGATGVTCNPDSTGGTGAFSSPITALVAGQRYHVRAYATNSAGTVYGRDVTFTAGKRPARFILYAPE